MRRLPRGRWGLRLLLGASLASAGFVAAAQDAAPAGSPVPMVGAMPGMSMPAHKATPAHATPPAGDVTVMDHASMRGMNYDGVHEGGSRDASTTAPTATGNPRARKAINTGAVGALAGPTHAELTRGDAMDMNDDAPIGMLLIDQLETYHDGAGNGQRWDVEGRYGNDENKLWLRTEGERNDGRTDDASVEAFWNHAIAPFWDTQAGVRADAGIGPDRHWAAFGIQGIAPFWFELEATGYIGPAGRTATRLRVEYELPLTQRLILQPELEANAYGQSDPARRVGSGLADSAFGLRLRYEFHRQVAPYVGVIWTKHFGRTADFAREDGRRARERQWVAGIRLWF